VHPIGFILRIYHDAWFCVKNVAYQVNTCTDWLKSHAQSLKCILAIQTWSCDFAHLMTLILFLRRYCHYCYRNDHMLDIVLPRGRIILIFRGSAYLVTYTLFVMQKGKFVLSFIKRRGCMDWIVMYSVWYSVLQLILYPIRLLDS